MGLFAVQRVKGKPFMSRLMHRFFAGFLMFLVLTGFFNPALAQEPNAPSSESLQGLVDLMENPEKREAFVKDLKNLIETKKTLEQKEGKEAAGTARKAEKQLVIVRYAFDQFENLSTYLKSSVTASIHVASRIPLTTGKFSAFFSRGENRARLFTLSLVISGAILIALFAGLLLRPIVRNTTERMRNFSTLLFWGIVRVALTVTPYACLWFFFSLLSNMFPSFSEGTNLLILFFALLFLYSGAIAVFRMLLSPEESRFRLLPVEDENANYLSIWARRFALYTFFYIMATRLLQWTDTATALYPQIRAFFLLGFPLMLTIFILQVAREIRIRQHFDISEDTEMNPHPKSWAVRLIQYWPILGLGYVWAIFLSTMFTFQSGFLYLFHATLGTVIALVFLVLLLRFLDWVFLRFFKVNERVRNRFPGMEEKVNRYVLIIRKGLSIAILLVGAGVIGNIWGIPVAAFVTSQIGGAIILRTVAVLITFGFVLFIIEMSQVMADYLLKEKRVGKKQKKITQKQQTLIPVIKTVFQILTGFVGGIIILGRLGVDTGPILAGAGIVGLAIGFGSQTLVKDLINGLFILFEESIRVGDWAMVDNKGGIVETVGLRTVKLRDVHGTVHVIPNSSINTLSNFSKIFSRILMDIGVAYREDVDEVMEIMKEVGEDLCKDADHGPNILEPLEIFGLDRFDDSAVIIRARFKTKPLKQWGVKREFYRRLKKVFDERGIEIPFPHRTLYMGEPKEGPSPPLHVRMQEEKQVPSPSDSPGPVAT